MSSPPKNTAAANDASARRSSGSNSGLFGNLMNQKRATDNTAYSQRRQSLEEQGIQKGVLGKLWDSAVKGVGPTEASK